MPIKIAHIQWDELYPKLNLNGLCAVLTNHCALLTILDNHWHFALNQEHSALHDKQQENLLAEALSQHFNTKIAVSIEMVTETIATPEKAALEKESVALSKAEEALQRNPRFRQILEQFHATIVPGSITSLEHTHSS